MENQVIKLTTWIGAAVLAASAAQAQYFEHFDTYTAGIPIDVQGGGWSQWNNVSLADNTVSTAFSHSAPNSLATELHADKVHSQTFSSGHWNWSVWSYVPVVTTQPQSAIFLSTYIPNGASFRNAEIMLDPTLSQISANLGPDAVCGGIPTNQIGVTAPLVVGAWAEIRLDIDLTADRCRCWYNNWPLGQVFQWTAGISGGPTPDRIQTIELYANDNTIAGDRVYWDDVTVTANNGATPLCCPSVAYNDTCTSAITIIPGLIYGTTVGATPSAASSLIPAPCGSSAGTPDVWYSYTPSCDGQIALDTCGLPCAGVLYNTVLSVYTGGCGTPLNEVAQGCNDDDVSCGTGYPYSSKVVTNVAGGTTYRIRVSGYNGSTGNFALQLTYAPLSLTNDDICNASVVACGTSSFSTCAATTSAEASPGCTFSNDVWYTFTTPVCAGPVTIATCGSLLNDTVLGVYSGTCTTPVFIACNDNAPTGAPCQGSNQSYVSFAASASTTYYIRVGAASPGVFGNGIITITCPPGIPTCPPPGPAATRLFEVIGPANGTHWAYRLTIPCCFDLNNQDVMGVTPSTDPDPVIAQQMDEAALAQRFVDAINADCPQTPPLAITYPYSQGIVDTYGRFGVNAGHCGVMDPNTNSFFLADLYVGPAFTPPAGLQKVDASNSLPTTGPVSFNPQIVELELRGIDCNGNGEDDYVDVLNGTSADNNHNNVPDECDVAVGPYCTAGTSSNNCVPVISISGAASASAASGFTINLITSEGQKSGLFFYGRMGQQAVVWGTGSSSFLCVKAPTQRTPVQALNGTAGLCDGLYSIDFNAYMANNPLSVGNPRFVGETFDGQFWYRDPPAPKTTNLSAGLHFALAP